MGYACHYVPGYLSHSFPSFHLAIHISAHLFNFEWYSRSRQTTDGSLASILSSLSYQEKEGDSWLNPIQSLHMVSWLNGKASGIWSWAGRAWHPWWTLCQAELSPFIDSGIRGIHRHCWSHWSDNHNSSGSYSDFSYGVYLEELFWGLLVYTPYLYHLCHWFRDSWHWVRSWNPHSHILVPVLAQFFAPNCLSLSVSVELSGVRWKTAWMRVTLTGVRSLSWTGWSWLLLQASPVWRAPCWGENPVNKERLSLGAVIVIAAANALIVITIISSALCWVL